MSGFSYPEWIGEIYPVGTKRKDMLEAYARIFNAVEINMTFRRKPEEKTIDRWRDSVPDDFRFAMKANQQITHWRRLANVADIVTEFMDLAKRLGSKLGTVLFQIPATLKFDAALIDGFGASLPAGYNYSLEPRDPSFLTDEAIDALRRNGIALCVNDDLFEPKGYTPTGKNSYFRFHRALYVQADLEERAALVRSVADSGDIYAFFAHEDNPESVGPALKTQKLLRPSLP